MTRNCVYCGEAFNFNENDGRSRAKKTCSENCRKRLCDDKHRATCIDCGSPQAPRSGFQRGEKGRPQLRCAECQRKHQAASHYERDQQIVAWWAEGRSMRFIYDQLGWTAGHLSDEMDRLRAAGHNLPYRRAPKKNAPRYPHLKAAA